MAAQLHQWLGRVQAARNALGYVHFCDSVERGLWRVNESVSVSTCSFTRMHQKGSPTSTVTNDVSHVPQSHMCGAEPHAWLGGSVQDLDTSAAAAALHWANAAKVAALSSAWQQELGQLWVVHVGSPGRHPSTWICWSSFPTVIT